MQESGLRGSRRARLEIQNMIRKVLSRLLKADLEPGIAWSEIESLETVAKITAVPRLWDALEQVLCVDQSGYVLFQRWLASKRLSRVTFGRALNGGEMRIAEVQPVPRSVFRLMLSPLDAES